MDVDERVDSGIKFLNQFIKDWVSKIDLKKLNCGSYRWCVCGQLFEGNTTDFYKKLRDFGVGNLQYFVFNNGFDLISDQVIPQYKHTFTEEFTKLTESWKRKIKELVK